ARCTERCTAGSGRGPLEKGLHSRNLASGLPVLRHTPCHAIRLLVQRPSTALVRVGVVDRAPSRLPVFSPVAADDESGRGLLLIDELADRWGYDLRGSGPRPWGKEVWAEFLTGADR
ncbi:ATP-binding protein, partial [Streptomyces sp. NRRL WC-3618]|uniref:ATP-binding protein n=1 Tax=Streptomyces sp. NRRL WC-3618 TaxID=1519490 RepID=UPI000B147C25